MRWYNPLEWFRKKRKVEFPEHYIRVVFTEEASSEGVFDIYQKEVQRIFRGKVIEKIFPSTEFDIMSLQKTYKIPIIDMTKNIQEEQFEFQDVASFGEVPNIIKR